MYISLLILINADCFVVLYEQKDIKRRVVIGCGVYAKMRDDYC